MSTAHSTANHHARKPPWWTGIVEWRNWTLPVKLIAVLVVPVVVALTAGVLQITGDVQRANSFAATQQLVAFRGGLMPLLSALQDERTLEARRLAMGGVSDAALKQQFGRTDAASTGLAGL